MQNVCDKYSKNADILILYRATEARSVKNV